MRRLFLSFEAGILVLGTVWAQNTTGGGSMPQLPVGQTFKQFEYPDYQDGKLKATLYAKEAKGITLNRAEVTDLKIQVYDTIPTTITSPKADLYVNEQKMRTKNTVQIDRTDMVATSQDCDFDLKTKIYLMRTNVKVVLKHFDLNPTPANGAAPASTSPKATTSASPAPSPIPSRPARNNDSLLDSPGAYADTNSAPIAPSSPDTK